MKITMRAGAAARHGHAAALAGAVALLGAGCGGVHVRDLPLQEDFVDCDSFTMNDEVATVDCAEGELRIVVSQPELSPVHFVPLRIGETPAALGVSAEARAPAPGLGWGVGCLGSTLDEPGRGYVLLVAREGEAGIGRLDAPPGAGGEGRQPMRFETLWASKPGVPFVRDPSRRHVLHLRCAKAPGGVVRLRASVDGGKSVTVTDRNGIAPFTAAFVMVAADRPGTDVRFDNVTATGG